jgi:hypothetical protein
MRLHRPIHVPAKVLTMYMLLHNLHAHDLIHICRQSQALEGRIGTGKIACLQLALLVLLLQYGRGDSHVPRAERYSHMWPGESLGLHYFESYFCPGNSHGIAL